MASKQWIPHPEEGYAQAQATGQTKEEKSIKGTKKLQMFKLVDGGAEMGLDDEKMKEISEVEDDHFACVPDVTTIRNVSNAAVLETLRGRYAVNKMYTFVDTIIVSCNPFQRLNLETAENMDKYAKCSDVHALEPHAYGIAKWALEGSRTDKRNQAILISGESGAGKTEACKILLGFFTDQCAGSSSAGVQDRIMQCNPILECLGNAKTSRNNNSSRFGKWTALYFDSNGGIAGAGVIDYLLEKSRVLAQSSLERDFHIFYMLIYADAAKYNLPTDAAKCGFLKSGAPKADGFDDKAEYQEVLHAFKDCTMPDARVTEFMQIMSGILLLGNMEFKDAGNDTSKIAGGKEAAAKGLGVDATALEKACVSKKLVVGKDVTIKSLKVVDACNSRDGLATLIYARTFTWIVAFLNKVISGSSGGGGVEIGLLDIAGFESFPFNTWEQITINLSNENLQQHFNDYIFKRELADYKAEGVPSDDITFVDNKEILDTIADPKMSIMTILDGESKGIPNDNAKADKKFIDNLNKAMATAKNKYYTPDKFGKPEFTLLHYAGLVKYDVARWTNEKNKDEPPAEAVDVLCTTNNSLLKEIADEIASEDAKTKKTVSQAFRASLKTLMEKIHSADPHFVRCIKPNDEKKPSIFTKKKVFEQLTYSGVMELVKIRRQGYPYRAVPTDFLKKFRCCLPSQLRADAEKKAGKKLDSKSPDHGIMTQIMQGMAVALDHPELKIEFQMGKSKVMIRMKGLQILEEKARYAKIGKAIIIQKMYRGFRVRKKMKRARELKKLMSAFAKEYPLYQGKDRSAFSVFKGDIGLMGKKATEAQGWVRECEGITFVKVASPDFVSMEKKLAKEAAIYKESGDLRKTFDIMKLEKAVAELQALKTEDAIISELSDRLKKLVVQVPLANGMATLNMPLKPGDLAGCKKAMLIVEQGEKNGLDDASKWIDPEAAKNFAAVKKSWDSVKGSVDKAKLESTNVATEEQKIAEARAKLDKAKASGDEAAIKEATEEIKKLLAGGRKMTVTGQGSAETAKFIEQLDAAISTYDRGEIEKVVKICLENGVDPNEIQEQREVMNKLRDPDYITAQLGKTMKSLQAEQDDSKKTALILACSNLMKAGKDAGVDQELLDKADAAVKKCAKGGALGGADEAQKALLELYGDYSKYPKINTAVVKPVYTDDGTKLNPMDSGGALSWSKGKLAGTLTQISSEKQISTALSAYRNILGWMTDHPVDEKRRAPLAYAIVWKARDQREELCTEMYAQVMKQINHNPGQRSRLLGWKLMVFMCKLAQPLPDFKQYIDAFLLRYELEYRGADDDHSREIFNVVHQCKECLANWGKEEQEGGDDGGAGGGDAELKVELYTMASFDIHNEKEVRKPQVIKVSGKATMKQLNKKAIEAMSLNTDVEHFGVHRADMDETPPDEAGCAKVCKGNKVVLRKRMLRPKEKIQSSDMAYSDMIVGQAVQEFHWYQIPEEESRIAKVGASCAFFWRGDSGAANISEDSVKTLVPKSCLKEKSAGDWVKAVQKAYDSDWKKVEDSPKLERISRVLKAHQNLKGFASRQFPCTQKVGSKPEGLDGVSQTRVETITDLGAASMLIAVTCTDVTLFDAKDGKELAKFGYGDSHRHKIRDWAAVKNRVSLAMNIPQGDVYMVLESEKADDIVKFLDRAHGEENEGKRKDAKKDKKDERDDRKKDRSSKSDDKKKDDKKDKKKDEKKDKKDDKKKDDKKDKKKK